MYQVTDWNTLSRASSLEKTALEPNLQGIGAAILEKKQ